MFCAKSSFKNESTVNQETALVVTSDEKFACDNQGEVTAKSQQYSIMKISKLTVLAMNSDEEKFTCDNQGGVTDTSQQYSIMLMNQ
ncbi:hypothetical protein J6590_010457 [Homalodisca vitripennis]|nr:hypothetical protein J6590_010457 [Homalodisca vitripennis]